MAEVIFANILKKKNKRNIKVASAGTMTMNGLPMTETAREALNICGEKIGRRIMKSTKWNRDMLNEYDHIVTMTQGHADHIGEHPNVYTLSSVTQGEDIFDPFMQSLDVYVQVCKILQEELKILYGRIVR